MQNVEFHAGSPGYLNLMTTQERLATLLVRVSYPGDLVSPSQERLLKDSSQEHAEGPHTPRLMRYEKPDVASNSMLEGKPCSSRSVLGDNGRIAELFPRLEPLDRCKNSIIRMNWSTASRLKGTSTPVEPVLSIANTVQRSLSPYNSMDTKRERCGLEFLGVVDRRL